jgi:hypothetical protein
VLAQAGDANRDKSKVEFLTQWNMPPFRLFVPYSWLLLFKNEGASGYVDENKERVKTGVGYDVSGRRSEARGPSGQPLGAPILTSNS